MIDNTAIIGNQGGGPVGDRPLGPTKVSVAGAIDHGIGDFFGVVDEPLVGEPGRGVDDDDGGT